MDKVIEIKNFKKKCKSFSLEIDDLDIFKGDIIGVIGDACSGKTTLFKCLLNISDYKGKIKILNHAFQEVNDYVGVVLDDMFFPDILKPRDIDIIMGDIYKDWDSNIFFNYLERFAIDKNKQIRKQSRDNRKKIELITALAHKPKILLLDEPFKGLGVFKKSEILDLIINYMKNKENTVLFTTKEVSDLKDLANQILIIGKGEIIANFKRDFDEENIFECESEVFFKIKSSDLISYQRVQDKYYILVKEKLKFTGDKRFKRVNDIEEKVRLLLKGALK